MKFKEGNVPTNMQRYLAVLANEAALAAQELGVDAESRLANLALNLNVLARFPEEADDFCCSEEWDEAPEDVLDGQCAEFAELVPGGQLLRIEDLMGCAKKARDAVRQLTRGESAAWLRGRSLSKVEQAQEAANRG